MMKTPFERLPSLKKMAIDFLSEEEIHHIGFENAECPGLEQELSKDPNYTGIVQRTFSREKSEGFFHLLSLELGKIRKSMDSTMEKEFEGSFEIFCHDAIKKDARLNRYLHLFRIDCALQPLRTPEVKVLFKRYPDLEHKRLFQYALDDLEKLLEKIRKYVIVSNSYGDSYRTRPKGQRPQGDPYEFLEKMVDRAERVLETKFFYDILSDEDDNVETMTFAFWSLLEALLSVPLHEDQRECSYVGMTIDQWEERQNAFLENRYGKIHQDFERTLETMNAEDICEALDAWMNQKTLDEGVGKKGQAEKELARLVGLNEIKENVLKIKQYALDSKDGEMPSLHMAFYGNPGTGKTEVARLIARIFFENGILPTDHFVETDRSGLVGEFVGETPMKTMAVIERATGGVLFIDEAYSLVPEGTRGDYGQEALSTLLKAMEDDRGSFVVIFAGYKNEMEKMLSANPGLKSRIPFLLDFPDYSREELGEILDLMVQKEGYFMDEEIRNRILDVADYKRRSPNFANAREIRNILEQMILNQKLRVRDKTNRVFGLTDIEKYIKANHIPVSMGKERRILSSQEELDSLIGLTSIKETIRKIRAYAKKNKDDAALNLHMAFYGNPGTGKTEVARLLSRIFFDIGVLPQAKMIEIGADGLIGQYVGETEKKTQEVIDRAMGGVLFIDEAYALFQEDQRNSYGKEAVAVLLKNMEDHRGQFAVILAGYRKPMLAMLSSNPGFLSRIAFQLDFPDYSREELKQIGLKMLAEKDYGIEEDAMESILDQVEGHRKEENFANARTLRNALDQAILNQNLRTEEEKDNRLILPEDVKRTDKKEEVQEKTLLPLQKWKESYSAFGKTIDTDYLVSTILSLSSQDGEQGTAFLISPTGNALTCAHCLKGGEKKARMTFTLPDGQKVFSYYAISDSHLDEENDIALFRVDIPNYVFPYLPLREHFDYQPLTPFVMAGYPFGGESYANLSISEGKIASVNRVGKRLAVFADMFGKPGNSGSPVLDGKERRVIGIFWGGIQERENGEMIKCFTPLETIWDFLEKI